MSVSVFEETLLATPPQWHSSRKTPMNLSCWILVCKTSTTWMENNTFFCGTTNRTVLFQKSERYWVECWQATTLRNLLANELQEQLLLSGCRVRSSIWFWSQQPSYAYASSQGLFCSSCRRMVTLRLSHTTWLHEHVPRAFKQNETRPTEAQQTGQGIQNDTICFALHDWYAHCLSEPVHRRHAKKCGV